MILQTAKRLVLLVLLLLAVGCTAKLPRTISVSGDDLAQVQSRWARFVEQRCPDAIDSDIRLGWQAYGRHEYYSATLQAAVPSFLRFAVVDPLGRPVLLLVSDGTTFTLVDNRSAQGYTGRLDSDFIREYLPDTTAGRDIFFLLNGRAGTDIMEVVSARRAVQGNLFWYETVSVDGGRHMFGLGPNHLRRHLFLDALNKVILDVQYIAYSAAPGQCGWPGTIRLEGEDLKASFTLEVTKIYGFSPPDPKIFELQIPAHFTVREVQ